MRKGSRKPTEIIDPEHEMYNPIDELQTGRITLQRMPDGLDIYILDILLRLCDACHEIDGRIEPWAGIRHDIERLK